MAVYWVTRAEKVNLGLAIEGLQVPACDISCLYKAAGNHGIFWKSQGRAGCGQEVIMARESEDRQVEGRDGEGALVCEWLSQLGISTRIEAL